MSILAPPPFRAPVATNHHVANVGTGAGTDASVLGYGVALIDVAMTSTGKLYVYGQTPSGTLKRVYPLDQNGVVVQEITVAGNYKIDLVGLSTLRVTIIENAGSITVRSVAEDLPPPQPFPLAPYRSPVYTNHHISAVANGTGTEALVSGQYGLALVSVTITGGTASVYLLGRQSTSTSNRALQAFTRSGKVLDYITESGDYLVNISGLWSFYASIIGIAGATVTVRSVAQDQAFPVSAVALRSRNTLIARVDNIVVAGGANVAGSSLIPGNNGILDLRDYAFVYVAVVAEATHSAGFTLEHLPRWHDNSGPQLVDDYEVILAAGAVRRHRSEEWLDVRSPGASLRLTNNDPGSHTYSLIVMGIR